MSGTLALIGGRSWSEGCEFDAELLAAANTDEVLVLPTAAAYERPEHRVAVATEWFSRLGAKVRALDVLARPHAFDEACIDAVRAAPFIYLSGGSAMHLRSVLKDSPMWDALVEAWSGGAVLAAASSAAMSITDPMVDPRGGAFSIGLALIPKLAIVAHFDQWSHEKIDRTIRLARKGITLAGVPERTALIRSPEGTWRTAGVGKVKVFVNGKPDELTALP